MRFLVGSGWVLLFASFARPAAAQDERSPAIWYRASEHCPTGAEFLHKLAENGHSVRLAEGGDHIDFVVTLLSAEARTVGRLERQTKAGTVAIRELRDATCERVADALALSLGLAVDPNALGAPPEPVPPETVVAGAPAPMPPVTAAVLEPDAPPPAEPTPAPRQAAPERSSRPRVWSVGVSLGGLYGLATHPLPRAEAFVSLDHALSTVLPELSLRLGVVGALGSMSSPSGTVDRTLLATRAEVCPIRLGSERIGARPCLVSELGLTRVAQDEASASSLWWASGLGLRGELGLGRRLRLEAAAGALLPVPRHDVSKAGATIYRDAIIAFSGSLAISYLLP